MTTLMDFLELFVCRMPCFRAVVHATATERGAQQVFMEVDLQEYRDIANMLRNRHSCCKTNCNDF